MERFAGRLLVAAMALFFTVVCSVEKTGAATYSPDACLLGTLREYRVRVNESLIEVALKFDLGFNAIAAANPKLDPWTPPAGALIAIPSAWIPPPNSPRPGIVINIPELRLYYFPRRPSRTVLSFPLGIGDQGWATPIGNYRVLQKIIAPAWHVPDSIRSESPHLPKIVPPGPDNPLGSHALRLSRHDLLIHGTNKPYGIGRRSSHGCLRLYPEDMVRLFRVVYVGTRVVVINQPIKVCSSMRRVYVESHRPVTGVGDVGEALRLLAEKGLLVRTDFAKLIRAVQEMKGMPVDVSLPP
jgi:L,D-transpeptidase ErfK/SrfK